MRIAVSGTHRVGKSSLVAELAAKLPHCVSVEEPYHQLEDDGIVFADPPSLDDFVMQLERSVELLNETGMHMLFDRCPVDILAYILCHPEREAFDLDRWLQDIRMASVSLDLIVFVRMETNGPATSSFMEADKLRRCVEQTLEQILVDDVMDLKLQVLSVYGDIRERTAAVMNAVGYSRSC